MHSLKSLHLDTNISVLSAMRGKKFYGTFQYTSLSDPAFKKKLFWEHVGRLLKK
jgi:hypothetical protein